MGSSGWGIKRARKISSLAGEKTIGEEVKLIIKREEESTYSILEEKEKWGVGEQDEKKNE